MRERIAPSETSGDLQGVYQLIPTRETNEPLRLSSMEFPPTTCSERWLRGDFTITPENNSYLDVWDIVVISALIFTAFAIPYQQTIVGSPSMAEIVANKAIDAIFTLDIALTFNVAFHKEATGSSSREVYERSPVEIAKRYMAWPFSNNMQAGWFWPDVLTVVPWDQVPFHVGINSDSIRIIRVLRLVRMLRLVRVLKLFKRWHTRSGFPYSVLTVMICASVTLMLLHWLACFWGHLGLSESDMDSTWLSNHLNEGSSREELTAFQVYTNALYLCTVVLTSVGFGDIVPSNGREEVLMIVTIFITGTTWAWVTANVVAVITNMDVFGTQFKQVMDDLNALMQKHGVDNSFKLKVRRHIHESYNIRREKHHHEALKWLSAGLLGEYAMRSGVEEVCKKFWYLRDLPEVVIIAVADEFEPILFSPGEFIMDRDSAYVIMRGTCISKGKVLSRDAVFGEDIILATETLRDTSCPRTVTFLEAMRIHRESLKTACAKFPVLDVRLRRAQLRLAVWRAFIRTAQKKLAQQKKSDKPVRISSWDTNYFEDEHMQEIRPVSSKELLKKRCVRSWALSVDKEAQAVAMQDDTRALIVAELKALREDVSKSHLGTERRWEEFDTRFKTVEKHLCDIDARVEELTRSQKQLAEQTMSVAPGTPNSQALGRTFKLRS